VFHPPSLKLRRIALYNYYFIDNVGKKITPIPYLRAGLKEDILLGRIIAISVKITKARGLVKPVNSLYSNITAGVIHS
jgi:hypothetical protein